MRKESSLHTTCGEHTGPITRAQAAALHTSNVKNFPKPPSLTKLLPTKPKNKVTRQKKLNILPDENKDAVSTAVAVPSKRKMALRDVTNVALKNHSTICRNSSYKNCIHTTAAPVQPRKLQRTKLGPSEAKLGSSRAKLSTSTKNSKLAVAVEVEEQFVVKDEKDKLNKEVQIGDNGALPGEASDAQATEFSSPQKVENIHDLECKIKTEACDACESMIDCKQVNIDSDDLNPQMCSTYAAEIYANLYIHELDTRPYSNFMETIQRDITQSMRAILVDWLVEVAEEYKLVPDTLYLTVHILDQFLSQNYIERQRLQLLGITCMLIASKYEEICAPRVEEFCFITDNTYTSEDVRKMEKTVLKYMGFRLSVPTVKTFLRRFLRAAQASYKSPTSVLEFLANYLVELTLIEYAFLKFTPSVVAASAVFLARWTMDQSSHPWNPTLEHYTCYKASDLKVSVIAMHCLQKNSKCCPLGSIRAKYGQVKFKDVANLPSQELQPSLFMEDTSVPT